MEAKLEISHARFEPILDLNQFGEVDKGQVDKKRTRSYGSKKKDMKF